MLLENFFGSVDTIFITLRETYHFALIVLGILWAFNILNWILGKPFVVFGIYPRSVIGLIGIVCSPFIHGNFNHLFFNSIPLFVLTTFMVSLGWEQFICATAVIALVGGGLTWLFGRKALHIGASGVIMGQWSYLLAYAYYERSLMAVLLGFVCVYYFGGLLFHLLPGDVKTSWEAHVFGFIGGLAAVYYCQFV